ncbi:hypothetical protein GH714_015028 [Hevea brasiliensis]|uniref:Uncharacterized protein n=1 Tax=Hevea brasiliensis TaxID=3981 RepID=A0A6A6NHA1_HEVBR|nr:hypothetical protein GH714_015028 [Hevea brasiliensis]
MDRDPKPITRSTIRFASQSKPEEPRTESHILVNIGGKDYRLIKHRHGIMGPKRLRMPEQEVPRKMTTYEHQRSSWNPSSSKKHRYGKTTTSTTLEVAASCQGVETTLAQSFEDKFFRFLASCLSSDLHCAVHGVEYAFGAHDYPTSGVFEVREFMEQHAASYHGSVCNCILPESLKISAVRHDPDGQSYDSERRRLRSAFSCLSSISMRQKQLSTSSMFLQSPLKGCLPGAEKVYQWFLKGKMKEFMESIF